jgi:predicted O-methyltransferase YrrM
VSLLRDPELEALLDRLHARSAAQGGELARFFTERAKEGSLDWNAFDARTDRFLSDKLVALDREEAEAARAHFEEAGLSGLIDLREGDLRETPRLRPGAIVVPDNTVQFRDAYRGYFEFVNDPANRFSTQTLPFEGGFELSVRV